MLERPVRQEQDKQERRTTLSNRRIWVNCGHLLGVVLLSSWSAPVSSCPLVLSAHYNLIMCTELYHLAFNSCAGPTTSG